MNFDPSPCDCISSDLRGGGGGDIVLILVECLRNLKVSEQFLE